MHPKCCMPSVNVKNSAFALMTNKQLPAAPCLPSPCFAAAPCWCCAVVERLGADTEVGWGPPQRDRHRHLHSLGDGLRNTVGRRERTVESDDEKSAECTLDLQGQMAQHASFYLLVQH
jgi:hypothetical protein